MMPLAWAEARETAWWAGFEARADAAELPFDEAAGSGLAAPLTAASDLPAFPTSAVDAWGVAGEGPWRVSDVEVLAGTVPDPIKPGEAVKVATGAQVPEGCEGLIRTEHAEFDGGAVTGPVRREWREAGEEAKAGEKLLPASARITAPVIGLAAAAGHTTLPAYARPDARLVVFGDELLTSGVSREGRVRDSLGPMLPRMLAAAGARPGGVTGPVADTLDAHVAALRESVAGSVLTCTTGGTMTGPVDHLHPALEALGAEYVVNTVAVRPGFPMLLARTAEGRFIAGLPGNPQSAVVALVTLVVPLLAGLRGLKPPALGRTVLAESVPGRGDFTHLALIDAEGRRLAHHGSAMLRGLAMSQGFAVIGPGLEGRVDENVPVVPVPGVER